MVKDAFGFEKPPSQCCGAAIITSSIGDRSWPVCSNCGLAIRHRDRLKVSGENAGDRIMRNLDNRITGEPKPTKKQVAMVLHALADHTAICVMVKYDRMGKAQQGEDPTKETKFWPTETSIGRWFHDVGHELEDRD